MPQRADTLRIRRMRVLACVGLLLGVAGPRIAPAAAANLPDPVSAPRGSRFT